ncbi:MAG TPA: PTS system mannose/fructose/sorbose family transporter subunit IID [Candidatus Sulfotelmatobacter sp.]|nr:PTS system mannose/fructose/sorbose family transporter subunit IID [Candidatus Sulfotelmatobacter sp.]
MASTAPIMTAALKGEVKAIKPTLERKDLRAAFWRYFWSFQISWNYERMQALGFAYAMEPVLRKLFPTKEGYSAALQRHLVFFNTNPVVGAPLIIGSAIAMEEAGAPDSAEGVKVALMGPLAGVGDTIVWALYNSIIMTIGAAWALQQNILGPIFVVVMVAVPYTLVRWWQFFWAYDQGKTLATRLAGGALERVTEGATVFGLIVFGGFIPSIVHLVTTMKYTQTLTVSGKAVTQTVPIQTQLDSILPFMLPVAVTGIVYWLLKRYNLNPLWAILVVAAFGLAVGWAGWFAPVLPAK